MSETNLQLFPGVFRSTVGGENPGFFLHSDGRVGIGNKAPTARPLWSSNNADRNKLNVTGHTHIDGNLNVTGHLYGDGSTLSGVAAVIGGYWDLDASNNNISYSAGNVGIGGAASTEKLKVHGNVDVNGTSIFRNVVNIQPSSSGGGQNLFTGYRTGDSYGRAQLVLSSGYSDIIIASSQANNNHGSNLSFAAYNPSNAGDYRKFVLNQGNWGSRMHMLDFGYENSSVSNPHSAINSTDTVLTLDGVNKRVGIGTINPIAKLHVNGSAGFTINTGWLTYFGPYGGNLSHNSNSSWGGGGSIYATSHICTQGYHVSGSGSITASDSRIKKEIVDVEDVAALEILRLLKPKKYKYVDEVKRGTEPVWGFIAQEVRDTLPHATHLITECIPNIYQVANVSASNVITLTNFDTSTLDSNAVLKVFDKDDKEHLVTITDIVDEHSIRVDEDLSELTGSIDESGNVVAGNQLFVYGQQVDDFVFLKKDSIYTVATAALQEVDRQLQAEKEKVKSLEERLAVLEAIVLNQ